jgi:cephalosporin-C deacetylase
MGQVDLPRDQLERYRSLAPEPADFDDFWATTLEQSRAHDLAPAFVEVDSGFAHLRSFDVRFHGFDGQPVAAWLHLPRAADGPLACVVQYIGYSGGRGLPHQWTLWASAGYAHLVMDTRGQGSGTCPGDTPDDGPTGPSVPGFLTRGIDRPEDYYYRRVMTDVVRAVEVAAQHEAVDPARIAVAGVSQGGGLALAAAGLADGVAAVLSDVPFLCDFGRALEVSDEHPYRELRQYLASHRGAEERVLATLGYFDGVCFARRATAPALISVALMDTICPPSTVYAAYAAYAGPKALQVYPYNGHEGGGAHHEQRQLAWLRERFALTGSGSGA